MGFSLLDLGVVLIYLVAVTGFGIAASGRQKDSSDYFLGGRQIPWWAVLFSVVATETSTLTFISIPAVAYGGTLTFLQITFGYILGRTVVSLTFLPKYYSGGLSTAYEFIGRRFGQEMRRITSSTFIITRLLADGVRLFASAIPLVLMIKLAGGGVSDWNLYMIAILSIACLTMIYTTLGGIRAVVWMDVIQMCVYLGGAVLAVTIILAKIPGGAGEALSAAQAAGKLKIFDLGFQMDWREFISQPYTFFVALIGGGVFAIASHGTDQLIVQRILTTRNLRSGQKALIGSGLVVFLQFALFLFVGILLFGFYQGRSPSQLGLSSADEIFSKFIIEEIPSGLAGLIIAAILAAAMSTLSSSINSLASATMLDFYKPKWGKSLLPHKELKISRLFTLAWGAVITLSAFGFARLQLASSGQRPAVVELGLSIASYTYGGLLGAFVLGLMSRKVGKVDAAIGFFTGLTALLFMVEGPIQNLLPGQGLSIAWPLYTLIGAAIVVAAGHISCLIRRSGKSL